MTWIWKCHNGELYLCRKIVFPQSCCGIILYPKDLNYPMSTVFSVLKEIIDSYKKTLFFLILQISFTFGVRKRNRVLSDLILMKTTDHSLPPAVKGAGFWVKCAVLYLQKESREHNLWLPWKSSNQGFGCDFGVHSQGVVPEFLTLLICLRSY